MMVFWMRMVAIQVVGISSEGGKNSSESVSYFKYRHDRVCCWFGCGDGTIDRCPL